MTFGRLKTIEYGGITDKGAQWYCVCSCGRNVVVRGDSLTSGNTKSCGCLQRSRASKANLTHGQTSSPTYLSWAAMLGRCNNPNNNRFYTYGARGIKVCKRWKGFENFLIDMGERPKGKTLDRVDVNKGYSLKNCRWATRKQQANNKRCHA